MIQTSVHTHKKINLKFMLKHEHTHKRSQMQNFQSYTLHPPRFIYFSSFCLSIIEEIPLKTHNQQSNYPKQTKTRTKRTEKTNSEQLCKDIHS